ncbi:MAG: HNH endonuclease, partial [Planctomycetes bacterium]|nr:HNH endonuclease [Planctomycetota bacterium]
PRVRGVGVVIRAPEVIVLARYDRLPRKQVPFTRRNLYKRDEHRCQYCGLRQPLDQLSIDHVVPRSRGGPSTWENCVLACLRCNVRKGDRPPQAVGMSLLRHPEKPEWSPCLGVHQGKRKTSWRKFVPDRYWAMEI